MSDAFEFGGSIVWRPTPEYIDHAHLTAFMRLHALKDFAELMERSVSDVAWFTDAVLHYLDIQFYEPYSKVMDLAEGVEFPKWCVDGKMNIIHNLLDKRVAQGTEVSGLPALIWEGEDGAT